MNQHAATVRHPTTCQDILDAPDHMAAELTEGALHLRPRRAPPRVVARRPERHRRRPRGVAPRPHARDAYTAWFQIVPDRVCEILGPGTRVIDLPDKRRVHAEAGVADLRFVDPMARTLEAFSLAGSAWTSIAALRNADDVSVAPFDAITFPLAALWAD